VPNFKVNYYRDSNTESTINFGDSYITKMTNIYYNAVSDDGYWALKVTNIYHDDIEISNWVTDKTALIDTSSPYLIVDNSTYDTFAATMVKHGFTCNETANDDLYLPVCYNDAKDKDECGKAIDANLTFTFMGGINTDIPTNETVPASNYFYYNGTTCISMVTWSDSLKDDTIVLADPFIITFIISFNLFM